MERISIRTYLEVREHRTGSCSTELQSSAHENLCKKTEEANTEEDDKLLWGFGHPPWSFMERSSA